MVRGAHQQAFQSRHARQALAIAPDPAPFSNTAATEKVLRIFLVFRAWHRLANRALVTIVGF
jgi:hypothetical protein